MRIGELASKFNISQSTIRYYISKGILIPTRKNSQYVFSQADIKELEIILELKKLFCSIDEIQEYLQILRLYNPQDAIEKKHLSLFLGKKYENLKTEITEKKNALKQIENLLSQFNFTDSGNCWSGIIKM